VILVSHRLRGHGSLADCLLKQISAVIEYLAHCGLRMYCSESEGVVSFWSWKVWFVTECDRVIFLYSTPHTEALYLLLEYIIDLRACS